MLSVIKEDFYAINCDRTLSGRSRKRLRRYWNNVNLGTRDRNQLSKLCVFCIYRPWESFIQKGIISALFIPSISWVLIYSSCISRLPHATGAQCSSMRISRAGNILTCASDMSSSSSSPVSWSPLRGVCLSGSVSLVLWPSLALSFSNESIAWRVSRTWALMLSKSDWIYCMKWFEMSVESCKILDNINNSVQCVTARI